MVSFVLSGFLVGGQVLARVRDDRFQLYDYATDRATRIFIPLIPACLFSAVASIVVFGHPPPLGQLLANMVGLNEIVTESLDINSADIRNLVLCLSRRAGLHRCEAHQRDDRTAPDNLRSCICHSADEVSGVLDIGCVC